MTADPTPAQKLTASNIPPWSAYDVLVALLSGYFIVPILVSKLVLLVQPWMSRTNEVVIVQSATALSWLVIFITLGLRFGWHTVLDRMGLTRRYSWKFYGLEALQLLIVILSLMLTLGFIWDFLSQHYPNWSAGVEPYAKLARPELLVLTFFAVVAAPLMEEIIFRGFVQSAFHRSFSPTMSVILTCLLFLLFHGSYYSNIKAMSHVITLGLCFGIWREKTNSLIPGIIVHLINNILASCAMLMH